MSGIKKLRPSPAMVVAFVALFVAGAGSAVAAGGMLDSGDIKNNSLSTKDVKDRSLLKKDFKRGQLPAGPQGVQGLQGPQGIAGAAGRAGRDGFGQVAYVYGNGVETESVEQIFDVATCPPGTNVVGGGVLATAENPGDMVVNSTFPLDETSWIGYVDNLTVPVDGDDFRGALAYAVCANGNSIAGFPQAKREKRIEKFLK